MGQTEGDVLVEVVAVAHSDGGAAVVLDNLTKRFGAQRGVTEVSLEVGKGQVFGFLGPNGAGKSTTIRLMLGLYRPTGAIAESSASTHRPRAPISCAASAICPASWRSTHG